MQRSEQKDHQLMMHPSYGSPSVYEIEPGTRLIPESIRAVNCGGDHYVTFAVEDVEKD